MKLFFKFEIISLYFYMKLFLLGSISFLYFIFTRIIMKKIVLTGGGTAGHVTPNIALLPKLKEMGYDVSYIGTYNGIEKKLIEEIGIPYYGIASGKLRRYFDWKNFSDPFRVIHGYNQAKRLMKELAPDIVFSKGGFVSVPVVLAAAKRKIPVVIHESDMTPGLANKIALPKASRVCCNFPETQKLFPEGHALVTGTPIRQQLFSGDSEKAFTFCGFTEKRPTILVIGGSTGALRVNQAIHANLDALLEKFNVIHLCGKGKLEKEYDGRPGYVQFEYIGAELPDLFALADLVISRAGANAICELLALKKANILIPLSKNASRGDQILNARSFEKSGYSKVIEEEDLTNEVLLSTVNEVYENRDKYIAAMNKDQEKDSISMITDLFETVIAEDKAKKAK